MNVQSMMDLLGSQQAIKAAKTGSPKTKSSASSSDLFSSIIGQKKDTKQNVMDIASGQTTTAAPKDTANPSQNVDSAAQDAAADDLQNADIVDETVQDTSAGNEAADDTAVTEDTEASEEPIIEEEEANNNEPQKIILSMQQMPVEAPVIAPVIITQVTNVSPEEAIVNDVSLGEMQMPTTEQAPEEQPVNTTLADLMPSTEEDAQNPMKGTLNLEEMPQTESKVPAESAQTQTQAQGVKASTVEELLSQMTPEEMVAEPGVEEHTQQTSTEKKEPVNVQMDAAEEFASQVVDEAKTMVKESVQDPAAQALPEEELTIETKAAEESDENMDDSSENQSQNNQKNLTQTPGTAQVNDDGRVNFKMSAAQPLEAEQFIAPETRQMIMNRVIDQVRTAVSPDKTEFYLQLKPDYLGGLSIALASEDKGIVAKIMTSSQQVHNALQADMNALQQVLRDRGINVVQMEVIYDQMANSTMKDNSDNRGQQFSQGQSNNRGQGRISDINEEALTMYDTLSSYEVLAENGGSVEFSA